MAEPISSATNGGDASSTTGVVHSIARASYPLPPTLSRALKVAIAPGSCQPSARQNPSVLLESPADALQHLVENALTAMDLMYFSTPSKIRQDPPCMQHRLCLRVATNAQDKTLTITDLGCGMTRADLINMLGVGRAGHSNNPVRHRQKRRVSSGTTSTSGTATSDEVDDDDEEEYNDDDTQDDDGDLDEEDDTADEDTFDRKLNGPAASNNDSIIGCKKSDIGGFYSALCTLGRGVKVGTKSKFDDYYEFQVGYMGHNDDECNAARSDKLLEEFVITRPREEGTQLTVETGFDEFHHIRGESGTMVTVRLQPQHYDLLDEANALVPLLTKILETTQYTFSVSSSEQRQEIIDASESERQRRRYLISNASPAPPVLNSKSSELLQEMEKKDTTSSYNSVKERAKYIPIRLSLGERKMLRLVEAAMNCCDYTSQVDRPFKNEFRRTHEQLKGITSILRGLVTSCDYSAGKKLAKDPGDSSHFAKYEMFFRQMLEIARRHKIMNPEKMRTEYGKLIYLLQDAVSETADLGFNVISPIVTVYRFLEERGGLGVLEDKVIEIATEEILADKKSRTKIDAEIRRKEKAVQAIKRKYRSDRLSSDDIHLCLYSICDNNSFLNSNRVPIDKVIAFLQKHFAPDRMERGYSLSIVKGIEGSRLSHSHERQYYFALQSLTLWREIIDDMFRLWAMGEADLLSETVSYSLQDTGQGMQRVQQSPRTYKAMQQILVRVQGKVQHWVGSSVIHLGDHNVPNALSFIDKYTQVPRILGPIVACLENLEKLCDEDYGIQDMVEDGFGGMERLRKDILYDFFRSAFDGSGADNFYDAGSCIDGRLTSAWNWCSQLPNKPFYPIFKLTGFTGFDGEFK